MPVFILGLVMALGELWPQMALGEDTSNEETPYREGPWKWNTLAPWIKQGIPSRLLFRCRK